MAASSRPPLLYAKSRTKSLSPQLFKHPTAEYRGTPFWSWNNALDEQQLLRQIDSLAKMGFGGFHIHARTGLATTYLGDKFMSAVEACVEEAKRRGMLAWLYDEDRWPSGFAGGLVTQDPQFRMRTLVWTRKREIPHGELLGRYEVELSGGRLAGYRKLRGAAKPALGRELWHAHLHVEQPDNWFNNQTYVDTFSRKAIERFIQTTHEHYRTHVGQYFGTTIPSIFTDEPHFTKMQTKAVADDGKDVIRPFCADFFSTFTAAYGKRLQNHLPELFWELPRGKASQIRYFYHDHAAERFARAFGDTLSDWCEQHGLLMTGHMLSEQTLHGQSRAVGEVMRAMRSFHLPGIDMLEDKIELTTAKQAQSLARQNGRPGVLSELYGVTNWDFDFAGHKRQGDWQAALGVTVRVPHLTWVSMAGESKRDYPASIGYQSPWYEQYKLVEDHFARVATVMTRGKPLVRVGIIHPIESYWLNFGCVEQAGAELGEREKSFADLANWMAYSGIDFDFICESILPNQNASVDNARVDAAFSVGQMSYDAVVVPSMRTIRASTLKLLTQFRRAGGRVIFAGEVPSLVDALESTLPGALARRSTTCQMTRQGLIASLDDFRDLTLSHNDGNSADSVVHQFRVDGRARCLFLCNTDRYRGRWQTKIRLKGNWIPTALDTFSGEWPGTPLAATYHDGETVIRHTFPAHGHLLLRLEPGKAKSFPGTDGKAFIESSRLSGPVPVSLSEPNVLLLDQAEWRIDDGAWRPAEELLRIDDAIRNHFRLPTRGGRMAQPWTDTDPAPVVGRLDLRFNIHSDIDIVGAKLALENPNSWSAALNEVPINMSDAGWFVDEAIRKIILPPIAAGDSRLTLSTQFSRKTNVEWCYLLGDFGVAVAGRSTRLTTPISKLSFGDWTTQGLPFYGGNVTYHCSLVGDGRPVRVAIPQFRNPLLTVSVDDAPSRPVAFAPFELDLGSLQGAHRIDITAFGNRANTFGPLHHTHDALTWVGPAAWRSVGTNWAYEYQLKKTGILTAPIVMTARAQDATTD